MMSENDDPSMLDEDFSKLFEESLKSVKPGEVVNGEVVQISNGFVTVDIGYKSEGQVPILMSVAMLRSSSKAATRIRGLSNFLGSRLSRPRSGVKSKSPTTRVVLSKG